MRQLGIVGAVCVAITLVGCVPKSSFDQVEAQLEECRQDKQAAQQSSTACEQRYEREVTQWEEMEAMVSDVLPKSLEEFRQEREKIIELVPEAARQEVTAYLDDFSRAVGQGFQDLKSDNQKLFANNQRVLSELEDARIKLAAVEDQTRSIDQMVGDTLAATRSSRDRMRAQAARLVQQIQDFDRVRINDKDSPERLRLNRTEREAITLFHDELVALLTALQGEGAAAPAADAEGAEPEVEG